MAGVFVGPPRRYITRITGQLQIERLVEAGSNTSTVALRVVGEGDGKGTQYLELQLGHDVAEGYKYGDLALQVGQVSNPRQ
jgi:hypothetical protein